MRHTCIVLDFACIICLKGTISRALCVCAQIVISLCLHLHAILCIAADLFFVDLLPVSGATTFSGIALVHRRQRSNQELAGPKLEPCSWCAQPLCAYGGCKG